MSKHTRAPHRPAPAEPTQNRKRGYWAAFVAIGVGLTTLSACDTGNSDTDLLQQSVDECAPDSPADLDLSHDGNTLRINHQGEEDTHGLTIGEVSCVLTTLDAPSRVTARMDQTRALDGTLEASWDAFRASWTYHPDNGLDVIISTDD